MEAQFQQAQRMETLKLIVSEETCSLAMTLTKGDLVDSIYNQVGLSIAKSVKAVESLLEIIEKTLENREDVLISRFGKFCVKGS